MKNSHTNEKSFIGNTLDFYNDDMSRKAVGKLFDNLDEFAVDDTQLIDQDTSNIVVGYEEHLPPEQAYEPVEPEIPDRLERSERSHSDTDRRSRVFSDEYDMSMYRRTKDTEEMEYDEIMRPRRRPRNPEPAVIRRADPPPENPQKYFRRRSAYIADSLPEDEPALPRRRAVKDLGLHKEESVKPSGRKPLRRAESFDREDKVSRRERVGVMRAAGVAHRRVRLLTACVAGIFIILMIAMALLLFRINSLSTRLKDAEAKLEESNTSIEHYQSVELINGALEKELADAKAELEEFRSQLQPSNSNSNSEAGVSEQTSAETGTSLPTQYVVQSGDNLSLISNKFYGTPNNYNKIKEANGLTSDTLRVGQTLTIPE